MFNSKSIRKEVLKAVEAKISTAQAEYEDRCTEIDAEAFAKKEEAFTNSVQSILSKLV